MEEPYNKREQDAFRQDILDGLGRIEAQTTKTNGRVSKLERNMLIVGTAVAVIVSLKFPSLLPLLNLI